MKKIVASVFLAALCVGCSEPEKVLKPLDETYLRPYKYYGQSEEDIYKVFNVQQNKAGYINVDNDVARIMFQMGNGQVEYIEFQLKETAPCRNDKLLSNVDDIFDRIGMQNHVLKIDSNSIHKGSSVYYDDTSRFKISAKCYQPGEALTLSFSRKYYRKI